MSNFVKIGPIAIPGRVWIAPMTGVTDLPFRRIASALGAAYVATEMVVSHDLALARPEAIRRAAVGEGLPLMVVQLVGADPAMIARGAALAASAGARVVDLNFGCPARSVTGIACGSALMRDLGAAERLIAAAVDASTAPVTVKMRLGWDADARNAPELAARAQAAGAMAITGHGRTRAQFYAGSADWDAVAAVKAAVTVPVIVNGDIIDSATAAKALARSGADAVMVGRAAVGRPWIARTLEAALEGRPHSDPGPAERLGIVLDHLAASIAFHGPRHGVRIFRKHLAAYVEAAPWPAAGERRDARARLCRLKSEGEIGRALTALWRDVPQAMAA